MLLKKTVLLLTEQINALMYQNKLLLERLERLELLINKQAQGTLDIVANESYFNQIDWNILIICSIFIVCGALLIVYKLNANDIVSSVTDTVGSNTKVIIDSVGESAANNLDEITKTITEVTSDTLNAITKSLSTEVDGKLHGVVDQLRNSETAFKDVVPSIVEVLENTKNNSNSLEIHTANLSEIITNLSIEINNLTSHLVRFFVELDNAQAQVTNADAVSPVVQAAVVDSSTTVGTALSALEMVI